MGFKYSSKYYFSLLDSMNNIYIELYFYSFNYSDYLDLPLIIFDDCEINKKLLRNNSF